MFDGIDAGSWGEIIVGLVAIAVGVYVVIRWQVDKRKISYQARVNPIIRVEDVYSDKVEIKFKGNQVKELTLFSITIKNTGNRPVLKTDWESPIQIVFSSVETKVLDIKTASSYPPSQNISIFIREENEATIVEIAPLLLNPSEGFKLQLVTSEFDKARIKSRLVGISELTNLDEDFSSTEKFFRKYDFFLFPIAPIPAAALMSFREPFMKYFVDWAASMIWFATLTMSILFYCWVVSVTISEELKLDNNFIEN